MKKYVAVVSIAVALGLSACSSKKSSTTEAATSDTTAAASVETAAVAESSAAVETVAAVETAAAETVAGATEAAATETVAAAAAAGGTYTLKEWSLEGSATLPAGQTTLSVTNAGNVGHEFIVIKDTTYEDAPKNDLGTVKEDALPAGSVLGEIEKIEAGATSTLAVNLTPGKYLFVCNIEFGPNSHAGKGQRLNVTVA
jgi:outer membrane lipoprotein SlyB